MVCPNLLGLKVLKISRSMEGGVDVLLMEGRFFVEDYRTGKGILDFNEIRVMFQENLFQFFPALVTLIYHFKDGIHRNRLYNYLVDYGLSPNAKG